MIEAIYYHSRRGVMKRRRRRRLMRFEEVDDTEIS